MQSINGLLLSFNKKKDRLFMKVVKKILMGLMLIFTVLSSAACEAKSNSKGKKMEILNGKDGLYAVLELSLIHI